MEEIPSIPRRHGPFGVALYAPLALAPFEPDIVLVRGTVKHLMLLAEATQAVGVAGGGATMGPRTWPVVPESRPAGRAATSLGSIGNRVYTRPGDEEGHH